jgi:putative SOS response-associated peptidase YedK
LLEVFTVIAPDDYQPRYNLAPTQKALIVRHEPDGSRRAVLARWGLVPSTFPSLKAASQYSLFNARSETVARSRLYRDAFRRRRCLVPVSGFFEWRAIAGRKVPYFITGDEGSLLALAGVWERWRGAGEVIESFSVLTTTPNEVVADLHHRMPVILEEAAWEEWLDASARPECLVRLLRPCRERLLDRYPVSARVGNVRHDDPTLIRPAWET